HENVRAPPNVQNCVRLQAFTYCAGTKDYRFQKITDESARAFLKHFLRVGQVVNVWVQSSNRYARVQLDSASSKAMAISWNTIIMERNGHYMRVHDFDHEAAEDGH
ncbi:hypothetical protein WJX84_011059, partial [Apatococcus fuscideae]